MVAALEQRGDTASLFSRREIPWHQLGCTVQDDITSTERVLELAKLDHWNLRKEKVQFQNGYSTHLDLYEVVRDNPYYPDPDKDPYNVLGIVGPRFEILHNEELAEFAELLLEGGRWETAGSILHGTTVFMSMALEAAVVLDPNGAQEKIDSYLVVINSHDGSNNLTAMVTNIRPVCKNTLDQGLRNASRKITIRHTKKMEDRMKEARRTLNLAANYNEEFTASGEALMQTVVNDGYFYDLVSQIYPEPTNGKKVSLTRWNNKIDDLEAIWKSDTIVDTPAEKNAWGVWNTIEEEFQWNRQVISDKTENFWSAGAGLDKEVQKEKTRLYQKLNELVFS